MKVALISDLHSNLAALEAVFKDMPRVERILCAGDVVGYGAEPNEVIKLAKKKKVEAVRGDHDHAVATRDFRKLNRAASEVAGWTQKNMKEQGNDYLRNLKDSLQVTIGGHRLFVVHGSPVDPLWGRVTEENTNQEFAEAVGPADANVVVLGHTHVPLQRMILGKMVVNPGSVGQPRDEDPKASYAILELGKEVGVEFRRAVYDVEKTARSIKEKGLPEELASRLFFGW